MAAVIRHFETESTGRPQLRLVQGGDPEPVQRTVRAARRGADAGEIRTIERTHRREPRGHESQRNESQRRGARRHEAGRHESASGLQTTTLAMVAAIGFVVVVALGLIARAQPIDSEAISSVTASSVSVDAEAIRGEVASSGTYIVERGDTLWSVAAALSSPGVDVRTVVDELSEVNGGSSIDVGQNLIIPQSLAS